MTQMNLKHVGFRNKGGIRSGWQHVFRFAFVLNKTGHLEWSGEVLGGLGGLYLCSPARPSCHQSCSELACVHSCPPHSPTHT